MKGNYFPVPESRGTIRYAFSDDEKKQKCGLNGEGLRNARHFQYFLNSGSSFGVNIIRHGWMADEYYTENVLTGSSFDIWSCTKSFTSMAFACLIAEESYRISYESELYEIFPEKFQPKDKQRLRITIGQLLDMTSGLRGAANGGIGMGVPYGEGAFEYALGFSENRRGLTCDLLHEPGTNFDYCDANYTLLALAFYHITGQDMRDYLSGRIFQKIGLESVHWDLQGGNGNIGPYTNGHTGLHISTRDLSRVGFLLLNKGMWNETLVLPNLFFQKLQEKNEVNANYGNGFWKNTNHRFISNAPEDTYFMRGYRANRCYVIPSLDMVVTRCGTGPAQWDEEKLLGEIINSII